MKSQDFIPSQLLTRLPWLIESFEVDFILIFFDERENNYVWAGGNRNSVFACGNFRDLGRIIQ